MKNFIFKSANRLTKNSSVIKVDLLALLLQHSDQILREQRHQRSDLQDVKTMINKLLIDKHLQQQVDTYFEDEGIPSGSPSHELEDK